MTAQPAGEALVLGPEDGASFWQPVPANGHVRNLLNDTLVRSESRFALGTQTVAPRAFIREHTHDRIEEVIFVLSGRGIARLDGVDHALEPGSCVYVGRNRKHHFLNPHDEPLTFLWLVMPGGLDAFFAEIGRPRSPGEPPPAPFPRPDDIAEIEARTVFGWTDTRFNPQP
ncbi:cupin domain-containing protein [Bosea sp. TWI1241]|jgi:mannose-6-phosphate isomerase-like protein (cupin superfamily)|uniref:cupin domain-containing protein n=1 Tax=Bosea sp. TWI1241 TaxID=3148904 RepID=UPI003207C03F